MRGEAGKGEEGYDMILNGNRLPVAFEEGSGCVELTLVFL